MLIIAPKYKKTNTKMTCKHCGGSVDNPSYKICERRACRQEQDRKRYIRNREERLEYRKRATRRKRMQIIKLILVGVNCDHCDNWLNIDNEGCIDTSICPMCIKRGKEEELPNR